MTLRENIMAILNYKPYDKFPIVHFGYWNETLEKWGEEGHIPKDYHKLWYDTGEVDKELEKILGFDFNWCVTFGGGADLNPCFEPKVLKEFPDGSRHQMQGDGVVVYMGTELSSIPTEISHTLIDRKSYEEHYKPKLIPSKSRINFEYLENLKKDVNPENPRGLHLGSLFGTIRNWIGVEMSAYMYADDEELFTEIIDDMANLSYEQAKMVLETGATFDYGHFWEDICFKNGPLISPAVFEEKFSHHYKRITDLLKQYGIDIVSLDCDGCIDALLPIWLKNGVNTMFPIEVGTWDACIAQWREKYGKDLRGVGGMNKVVFAQEREDIDREVDRLKKLIDLGGYIPCPDHRIAPDAKFDNVKYYTYRMREVLNK